MAAGYVNSAKIKAFPAAGRSGEYPEGFLTTEDNLSGFIKSIYKHNNSSFVINKDNNSIDFVIHGYFFSIAADSLPEGLTLSGNLWAGIYLKDTLEEGRYKRLVSSTTVESLDEQLPDPDSGNRFTGLLLADSQAHLIPIQTPSQATLYSLHILNSQGQVPEESKFRYTTAEILDDDTDGLVSEIFTTGDLRATDLNVFNQTDLRGDLDVSGSSTLKGDVNAQSDLEVLGTASLASAIIGTLTGNTNLTGTITGGTISGSTINGGTINGSTLSGVTLSDGTISGVISGGTLSGTTLSGGTISGGKIKGSTLSGVTLSSGTISGVISGGTLSGTTLSGGTMDGGTIKTSAGTISVANIMTEVTISNTTTSYAGGKTLNISLVKTKGKN